MPHQPCTDGGCSINRPRITSEKHRLARLHACLDKIKRNIRKSQEIISIGGSLTILQLCYARINDAWDDLNHLISTREEKSEVEKEKISLQNEFIREIETGVEHSLEEITEHLNEPSNHSNPRAKRVISGCGDVIDSQGFKADSLEELVAHWRSRSIFTDRGERDRTSSGLVQTVKTTSSVSSGGGISCGPSFDQIRIDQNAWSRLDPTFSTVQQNRRKTHETEDSGFREEYESKEQKRSDGAAMEQDGKHRDISNNNACSITNWSIETTMDDRKSTSTSEAYSNALADRNQQFEDFSSSVETSRPSKPYSDYEKIGIVTGLFVCYMLISVVSHQL